MSRKRKPNKKNIQKNRQKPEYKGPYQDNPNLIVQDVKKSMRPEADGPTVDTFSPLDSTTNMLPNEENDIRQTVPGAKRPTKEKKFTISRENIFFLILGIVATGIGIIVYTHSNKFVAVEKDIDYIKEDIGEQKELVKEIDDKTNSIDKNLELLNQKVEFEANNNR